MDKGEKRSLTGILLLILACFTVLVIFVSYSMRLMGGQGAESSRSSKASVAVVEIKGLIMNAKDTVELLRKAEKDKSTKAILLRINSPGGAVGPTQEIYDEVRRIDGEHAKSKGKRGRPVYASFGSIAASGGYYIGSAARKIFSNPGTLTGSIGVIMEFVDLSELFRWLKMNPQKVKAGRYKDIGNPNRAMTGEERSMMEKLLEGVRQQFVRHIVEVRGKRIQGDIDDIAQGQIFSGEQAFELGLVDELKGLYGAGQAIHSELKLKGEFGFKFIKKAKKVSLFDILERLETSISRLSDLESLAATLRGRIPVFMFQ